MTSLWKFAAGAVKHTFLGGYDHSLLPVPMAVHRRLVPHRGRPCWSAILGRPRKFGRWHFVVWFRRWSRLLVVARRWAGDTFDRICSF